MKTCVRVFGKQRSVKNPVWHAVICFVVFSDPDLHLEIVEKSFKDDLGLNLDDIRRQHPDHFYEPGNVARAILLYHYFRSNYLGFDDTSSHLIAESEIPNRTPDSQGEDFSLWVDQRPIVL
jgi:hypothetical protein